MIHPSYVELMKVVNDDVVIGEEPVVNSRYSIVCAAAHRARQLIDGSEPLIMERNVYGRKPLSIAVDELFHGDLKILTSEEAGEEQEKLDQLKAETAQKRALVEEKRAREEEEKKSLSESPKQTKEKPEEEPEPVSSEEERVVEEPVAEEPEAENHAAFEDSLEVEEAFDGEEELTDEDPVEE